MRTRFGHLHSHRRLARDGSKDAHLLGGQRVGDVVLELSDLGHLDSRRQTQLVARHVRPAHGPHHPRVDVEVAQRLGELEPDALDPLRVDLLCPVGALQVGGPRHPVVDALGFGDRRAAVPHRRELLGRGVGRGLGIDRLGKGLGRGQLGLLRFLVPDGLVVGLGLLLAVQIRVTLRRVECRRLHVGGAHNRLAILGLGRFERLRLGRGVALARWQRRGGQVEGVGRAPHAVAGGASGLPRGTQQARDRGAGQEQHPGQQQEDEQDVRAGDREELARGPRQALAHQPAMALEIGGIQETVARGVTGAQPERAGGEAERQRGGEAEGARLERVSAGQCRPHDEQRTRGQQRDRRGIPHGAEQEQNGVGQSLAHLSPGPVEVEETGEEGRERDQPEPDQVPVALLEPGQVELGQPGPAGTAALPAARCGHPGQIRR